MQTLESLHIIGKTMKAVLDSDLKAELSAHSLYAEAAVRLSGRCECHLATLLPHPDRDEAYLGPRPIAIRSKITGHEACLRP